MPKLTDIVPSGDLARIKNLQLLARTVVEGYCTGLHQSPHKGFSVEFKQHRPYVKGDEIKRIDWKVFGRSDRFYIREYEEETNLRCHLIVDVSGSMAYEGTGGVKKFEFARRTAACLAYLMMMQADSVGLMTFDTKVREFLPNRSVHSHLGVLIDALDAAKLGGETDIGSVLTSIVPRIPRRGLVVLVSDCFGDITSLMKSLAQLRHRGHEVLVFQIWDRDELDFPFKQWTRFINLEDEADMHMIDPATLRRAYLKNLENYRNELKAACQRNRIDLIPFVTDQAYTEALSWYLSARARARRRGR